MGSGGDTNSINNSYYSNCWQGLAQIPAIELLSGLQDNAGIVTFNVRAEHPVTLRALLDQQQIAVRAGTHCAMPLFQAIARSGAVRLSLAAYNQQSEIDRTLSAVNASLGIIAMTDDLTDFFTKTATALNLIQQQQLPLLLQPTDWQSRYRTLMQLGNQIPAFVQSQQHEQALISGCDSKAWLLHQLDLTTGRHYWAFDSEAQIN